MPLTLEQRGPQNNYYISGTHLGYRVRRCTKTTNKTVAEVQFTKVIKEIERRAALGDKETFTFAEAVDFYLKRKDPNPFLASNIKKALDYFKTIRCSAITQAKLTQYEDYRYKNKRVKNSSRISACFVPISAVINFAADHGLVEKVRFKKPKTQKAPVIAAPDMWIAKILTLDMQPWVRCAVLICTYHGVRPASLVHLTWANVNFDEGTLYFTHTKNGRYFAPRMHPDVLEGLRQLYSTLPEPTPETLVFPLLPQNHAASTLNNKLKSVCARHKLPFYSTHKLGRHAFAHRLLKNGRSLAEVMRAGNWESISVVASAYGHLEQSHIDEIVCNVKIGGPNADIKPTERLSLHPQMHEREGAGSDLRGNNEGATDQIEEQGA